MENRKPGPFAQLYERLTNGEVSRGDFFRQSMDLGVAKPVALFVLNNVQIIQKEGVIPDAAGILADPTEPELSLPDIQPMSAGAEYET